MPSVRAGKRHTLPFFEGEVVAEGDVHQDGCPVGTGLLAFRAQRQEKPMSYELQEQLAMQPLEKIEEGL